MKKKCFTKATALLLSCVLGGFCGEALAQTANPVVGSTTTYNGMTRLVFKTRSVATQITFTLTPEPLTSDRLHYPIIFIEWYDGTEKKQQMINLAYDMTFTLPLAPNKVITVYGEDGIWSVKANGQDITQPGITSAPALRAVELNDNYIGSETDATYWTYNATYGWRLDSSVLPNLKFLSANRNLLSKIQLPPNLCVLELSGNRFTEAPYIGNRSWAAVDLSMNMLTTAFTNFPGSWKSGTTTADGPYESTHSRKATEADSLTMRDDVTYQSRYFDVSHNRIPLGYLPAKPTNLPDEHYLVSYQERFPLPIKNSAGTAKKGEDGKTAMYTKEDRFQIESVYRSFQGIATAAKPTTIKWYVENDAATDDYTEIPSSYYTMDASGYVQFLKHPTGNINSRIFAVAIPAEGTMPTAIAPTAKYRSTTMWSTGTTTATNFQSYERTNSNSPTERLGTVTTPLENMVDQPAGTATAMTLLAGTSAGVTGDAITGDGTDRSATNRFYRSNPIVLDPYVGNYWHGTVSREWSDPRNWTNNVVPITTKAEFLALTTAKRTERSTVTFATNSNNNNDPAIRDLELDQDRYIQDYNNMGERKKVITVPAGLTLYHYGIHRGTDDNVPTYPLHLRAEANKPNGSYIYAGSYTSNAMPRVQVDFYAKGDNANVSLSQTKWQYFSVPVSGVQSITQGDNALATTQIREYKRSLTGQFDNKWTDITSNSITFERYKGYEIAQATPTTYSFYGTPYYGTASFPLEASTENASIYQNMQLFGNPYLAAIPIKSLTFPSTGVDKVVYLFNTGSREQWLAGNGGTTANDIPGSYTQAIPQNLSGYLATMPQTIPTLSTFMVKAWAAGNISVPYTALVANTEVNRARRSPESEPSITSLTIDLLNLKDSVAYDRLWLVTAKGTSKAYDNGYDAEKFISGNIAQLYAMGETNYQVLATDNIHGTPLALTSGAKERQLVLRFHIERPEFNVNTYYIDDHLTGATVVVRDGDTYTFTAKPEDALHRFTVRTNNVLSVDKVVSALEIVATGNRSIEVRNHSSAPATAKLYDVKGVLLETLTIGAGEKVSTDVDMPGLYLVQATNGTDKADVRLLLK